MHQFLYCFFTVAKALNSSYIDADRMSHFERSERAGRQGQRRRHHRWSGPDHFYNDSRLVRPEKTLYKSTNTRATSFSFSVCLTLWLFFLSVSFLGPMSSSTMMVLRLQGSLHGPSPLKAGSTATWRCWMNSHSNTWLRTAAHSRTSCSGSKRCYRFVPCLQKDEWTQTCTIAHSHTYAYSSTGLQHIHIQRHICVR